MNIRLTILVVLGSALLAAAASAQTSTALLVEGQPLPGGPAGHLVVSINNPAVNHSGGYAFNVNTEDATTTLSHFWSDGVVLRTEGTHGIFEQTSWESFYGLGGGMTLGYSPMVTNLETGSTGLDGVWRDDTPIAVEEEPYPWQAGYWWSFGSRPGVTEDGVPYFVGGITDVPGGATDNRGLFYGLDAEPLLLGGQQLPGLPAVLSTGNTISFDYRFSAQGTNYIGEVETVESSASNNYLVVNGAPLLVGGQIVGEGRPVPAAAGGLPGESWANFDFAGITESGLTMFTGDTNAATSEDEIVVVGGQVVMREGDYVGDVVQVTGSISGAYLNEDGDYAVAWEITESRDALLLNGEVLLLEGNSVDLDGDGLQEDGTEITAFTGISSLVLSDREPDGTVRMYFTADVLTPEGEFEMALVLPWRLQSTPVEAVPSAGVALAGAWPNPFNPRTQVTFTVGSPQHVRLTVHDAAGREVAVLADGPHAPGTYQATWDGTGKDGARLASGAYLARLQGRDGAQVAKLTLVK